MKYKSVGNGIDQSDEGFHFYDHRTGYSQPYPTAEEAERAYWIAERDRVRAQPSRVFKATAKSVEEELELNRYGEM